MVGGVEPRKEWEGCAAVIRQLHCLALLKPQLLLVEVDHYPTCHLAILQLLHRFVELGESHDSGCEPELACISWLALARQDSDLQLTSFGEIERLIHFCHAAN
jgi:hypothetical protein